ncbi:MAG: NADH-quinone oxidoreductase subunit D [Deltaproteobacteria bacterium]|nr:NADH-quinone oxidoreductase subunit D [Deltaproteobacteria bacterium]
MSERLDLTIRRPVPQLSRAADIGHLPTDDMIINLGPSHPATHGTVNIRLVLDGERIKDAQVNVGYLHRGFEKECEAHTWAEIFPYTDRLNYASPMLNNVGFAMAVEKLLGIAPPLRAQYIQVIVGELARLCDHLTYMAAQVMEMGALTVFFYAVKGREWLWDLLEEISGARLTHSYVRIGGVAWDMPEGWPDRAGATLLKVGEIVSEIDRLVTRNRIFLDRMEGIAVVSAEDAVSFGWTGPCLRASGVEYDVRKAHPYRVYDRFDFEIPIGTNGDNLDRYLVRIEEVRQSIRIIQQALEQVEPGPVLLDDPRVVLPPKRETYNTIEGLINHFKLVVDGIRVPAGETYSYTEASNGELGFYLVSDGTGRPVKCRCRPPCFMQMTAMEQMLRGQFIADLVPIFDTLNMIGGECDR